MKSTLFKQMRTPLIVLAVLVVVVCVIVAVKRHQPKAAVATNEAHAKATLAVETVQAQQVDWPTKVTVNGAIAAWQEAQVSAEISGLRIRQVLVDVGSEVKRGQDLVLLADETVLADLHKQQATVARDEANLAEAKANAERARQIKESGAMSAQQINQYLIAEETAAANLALSKAELENQQIRLKQTHVVAADDGVIASRSANLGNVVNAGTELFRLVRQGRVEWRAEVNAQQLNQIKVGQKVDIRLPDGKQLIGKVRIAAPTVDVNTRNAIVYVDIANPSAKPGMYAEGSFDIGQQAALVVPQSAVVLRDGRSYLFAVMPLEAKNGSEDHAYVVKQINIKTGRRLGELVEIAQGLEANLGVNGIVKSGGAFLNDGDVVTVVAGASAQINQTQATATQAGAVK